MGRVSEDNKGIKSNRDMKTTTAILYASFCLGVAALFAGLLHAQSFDKLSDADREVYAKRFKAELWPLLSRNGKDGCVGCHGPKHQSSLHFTGQPDADFRMLLRDGFFLYKDAGSMLEHVASKDERSRMPPGDRPRWTAAEIKLLTDFTMAVDKKQK